MRSESDERALFERKDPRQEEVRLLTGKELRKLSREKVKIFLLATLNCLGSLLVGYTTAVISGCLDSIDETFKVKDKFLQGFLVSVILIGGLSGSLVSGIVSDKFGRMKALLFVDLVYVVGSLLSAFSYNYWMLVAARFVVGVAAGMAVNTFPPKKPPFFILFLFCGFTSLSYVQCSS